MYLKSLFYLYLITILSCLHPSSETQKLNVLQTQKTIKSNEYVCFKNNKRLKIDGNLNESAWQRADWTIPFLPIQASRKTKATYQTKAKMLWDKKYLYIAAELKDEHIWATLRKRDTKVYKDDVFEIFLDPDGDGLDYYELQINAFETIWDLSVNKPYRDGGKANSTWTIDGLQKAIRIEGTLNNSKDLDKQWTIELAIPWEAFAEGKPQVGEKWRINLTRIDWDKIDAQGQYSKMKQAKNMWLWSPVAEGKQPDFHQPEKWGYVQFLK